MWRERIIEAKKNLKISTETMSERTLHIPERTIIRMLNGETRNPRVDTILEVGASVGLSPQEIFSETNLVIGDKDLATLQSELEAVKAERDLIAVENEMHKKMVEAQTTELELLKKELAHKDELLALHNFYKTHFEQIIKKGDL